MIDKFKFHVTDNGLARANDIKYLSITNDIYDMNIFYYGDYTSDKAAGRIEPYQTLLECKPDGVRPEIKYVGGHIHISIAENDILCVHRVEEYKHFLDDAKESAIALGEIMKQFGFKADLQP